MRTGISVKQPHFPCKVNDVFADFTALGSYRLLGSLRLQVRNVWYAVRYYMLGYVT